MTLLATPHNLPLQLTSFIGRELHTDEVARALLSARLLTLTGAGGAGKTRLSIEVACRSLELFPDGVWLVELAALDDPALVAPAVAATLGLREEPDRALPDTIAAYLASRKLLLALDNCEHLVKACAALVSTLLPRCPDLTIMATSRQLLNVSEEKVWRVPALSFPDPHHPPDYREMGEYEAVRLFVERARSRPSSSFTLTADNALHVAQLCYHLDGLPLAIELAAARTPQLGVEEIAGRLDERLRLLTADSGGARGTTPRHQTLRATIDWGYDLLSVPAQRMLRQLSVFAGNFALDAVEGVCAEEGDEYQTIDLLSELADGSLLVMEERQGEARYRLLDTIRNYAERRSQGEGEAAALRERHVGWYMALAERAKPEMHGPQQAAWLDRLGAEHDNLRAALGYSEAVPQNRVRLARSLYWYWYVRGHLSEGRRWMEGALAASEELPVEMRADARSGTALLARAQGDYERAVELFGGALELFRALEDRKAISVNLTNLSVALINAGDYEAAVTALQESARIREAMGDKPGVAITLNNLGNISADMGDYAAARSYYAACLEIQREVGNRHMLSVSLNNLGNVARCMGEYDEAEKLVRESLAIKEELRNNIEIASSLHKLAEIEWCRRNYVEARRLCEAGLAALEGTGDKEATALLWNALGEVARMEGQYDEARGCYERALSISKEKWVTNDAVCNLGRLAQIEDQYEQAAASLTDVLRDYARIGAKRGVAEALVAVAKMAAARGVHQEAATLFGSADGLLEATGYRLHPDDSADLAHNQATVRARTGKKVWESVWGAGRSLTMAGAVEFAVTLLEGGRLEARVVRRRARTSEHPHNLTGREVEVLRLLAEGMTDAQIASRLSLSANTVHAHLHSIYGKVNVATRAAAGRFAIDNDLT